MIRNSNIYPPVNVTENEIITYPAEGREEERAASLMKNQPVLCLIDFFQFRQGLDDADAFHADPDHTLEQVKDVAGIIVFPAPVIGIIQNAALLVRFDLITFHDPFNG